jgi:uncharacterized membrane protein
MTSWSLEPLLGSWLLVFIVAVLLIAGLWIKPQFASVSPTRMRILFGLRLLLILLVILAMVRPGVVWTQLKSQRATLAVLLDFSASQQLPSDTSGMTRWRKQQELWETVSAITESAKEDVDVVVYSYDEELRSIVKNSEGNITLPEQPLGKVTDIGKALSDLTAVKTESPLAGVVFIGDGTITADGSAFDPAQIARQLGQMDQPIIAVGNGPRGGAADSRDIAIEGVAEEMEVFSRNRLDIKGTLRLRGLVGAQIPLQVSLVGSDGKVTLIEKRTITPRESDEALPFSIPATAPEPGEYRIVVEAENQTGEAITTNNLATSFVTVKSGGVRALYIEGQPRQEQVFLRRSINASPDIQLDFLIIPPSTRSRWPIDLKSVLAGTEYDAFILGDLDSAALGTEQLQILRERIQKGAGLLLLGGFHAYDGGGYGGSPLADILPIQLRGGIQQPFGQPVLAQLHWEGELKIVPSGAHPVTQLGIDAAKNGELWSRLPALEGANRWLNVKPTPGIQVIAASDKQQPLIVATAVEQGRVLAMAGDSTWKWWMHGEQQLHKQFWRQALLWVLGRDRIEEGLSVSMEQRRLYKEQTASFRVRWQPGTGQQEIPKDVLVEVERPDGSKIKIATQQKGSDILEGSWQVEGGAGIYKVRATTKRTNSGDTPGELVAELPFLVLDNSVELANPIPDWQLLSQLAESTKESGGVLVDGDGLSDALKTFVRRLQSQQTEVELARRLGDSATDQWIYLSLFAMLLVIEWWLRKKWQMA